MCTRRPSNPGPCLREHARSRSPVAPPCPMQLSSALRAVTRRSTKCRSLFDAQKSFLAAEEARE